MPAERYFIEEKLASDQFITLKDSEFHHLVHVMRTRKGERVELINGNGTLALATLEEVARDKATLLINNVQEHTKQPSRLILAQALPKQNRLDFILEKGTELGVDEFWLFPGDTSVKKEVYPNQLERNRVVTIAATKQCGRLFVPDIKICDSIEKWKPFATTAFYGDVDPAARLLRDAWHNVKLPVIFVTGPESGFTGGEVDHLKKLGAQGVKLHDNILRTDTASLAAVALIYNLLMQE